MVKSCETFDIPLFVFFSMTMIETDSALNPYAPASEVAAPGVDVSELLPDEFVHGDPIPFSGHATDADLWHFLKQSRPRGLMFTLAITVVLFGMMYVRAVNWPWQLLLGGIAAVVILLNASLSPSVRRSEYVSIVNNWNAAVSGCFDARGILLDDGATESWQSWACISNAYADDQIVAFQSALQPGFSRLITPAMIASEADWQRLVRIAWAIHCDVNVSTLSVSRIEHAYELLADDQRPRALSVAETAIPFCGELFAEDLPFLEAEMNAPANLPTVMLSLALIIAVAVVLAGLSGIAFGAARPFDLVLGYGAILCVTVAVWKWLQGRASKQNDQYLTLSGFIDADAVTLDFGICWRRLRLARSEIDQFNDQRIVLRDPHTNSSVTLRADMFESTQHWLQARRFAAERPIP
jgi:hypothetical protein